MNAIEHMNKSPSNTARRYIMSDIGRYPEVEQEKRIEVRWKLVQNGM